MKSLKHILACLAEENTSPDFASLRTRRSRFHYALCPKDARRLLFRRYSKSGYFVSLLANHERLSSYGFSILSNVKRLLVQKSKARVSLKITTTSPPFYWQTPTAFLIFSGAFLPKKAAMFKVTWRFPKQTYGSKNFVYQIRQIFENSK